MGNNESWWMFVLRKRKTITDFLETVYNFICTIIMLSNLNDQTI